MWNRVLHSAIFLTLASFPIALAQEGFIPAFELYTNDLELTRPAQPLQYFDKIGMRAGLMGYESGTFEMWIWPWKPLRNFELSFLLATSTQPILARDIIKTISVTPEATVLTYTYESFTVREIIFVPRDEPGAILLLDVHTTVSLTIVSSFLPVLQPMWPAGIGGQFSYWDDDVHAYVISEGQWRAIVLCGSPAGRQMAAPPAHMLADNPLQFQIEVTPGKTAGKFIPIVITGGGAMKMDSVRAIYNNLWKNAEKFYNENYEYYRTLRSSTMQVITPDKELNLAYEWGKVSLDNLMVSNPTLGYGMVAGFGLSGNSARPGFAWFFGGDAFINSLTFNSFGAYETVRDALVFTQKWQRQEDFPIRKKKPDEVNKDVGKMAHELSQSDGLCDWWNDYHYGYNHADTTPWYIVAMGDYVRTSGDGEFLKKSWNSVKQAYDWCLRKDSDGDGLMDLKGAGLGALEFGKLVGIYADAYTCGVWVQAVKEMTVMARLVGDEKVKTQADRQYKTALMAFDKKFWITDLGYYSYGATEKGEQVKERGPWPAAALMFGFLDDAGFSKNEHKVRSLEFYNSSEISTDWGTRSLSPKSSLFEPTNYNYGAVWPFLSTFVGTTQYRYHYSLSGYTTLQSVIKHVFDNALGHVPEVFSGELNQKLGEAYHHQGFSTTGYMLPLVRGMLGLEVDAIHNKIIFAPHIPNNWDNLVVRGIRVGNNQLHFELKKKEKSFELRAEKSGPDDIEVEFSPGLSLGSSLEVGTASEEHVQLRVFETGQDIHVTTTFRLRDRVELTPVMRPSVEFYIIPHQTFPGATNHSLKILSQKLVEKKITLIAEGIGGETYQLGIRNQDRIASVKGAVVDGSVMKISFEKKLPRQFAKQHIEITLR